MFVKRTQSIRKGPTDKQIYIPKDQRRITKRFEISNQQDAKLCFNKLYDIGYISNIKIIRNTINPIDSTKPYFIFTLEKNGYITGMGYNSEDSIDGIVTTNNLIGYDLTKNFVKFLKVYSDELIKVVRNNNVSFTRVNTTVGAQSNSTNVTSRKEFKLIGFFGNMPYIQYNDNDNISDIILGGVITTQSVPNSNAAAYVADGEDYSEQNQFVLIVDVSVINYIELEISPNYEEIRNE